MQSLLDNSCPGVVCLIVETALEELHVVRCVDVIDFAQVSGNDLHAVIIGRGIVDGDLRALDQCIDHLRADLCGLAEVLPDRLCLLAGNDGLDGGDFSVLTGDNGKRAVSRAVTGILQRGNDADGQTVIGNEDCVERTAVGIVGGDEVILYLSTFPSLKL